MTNEEALRLARLAYPGRDVKVETVLLTSFVLDDDDDALLQHYDRRRFEAALRALAGEKS